MPKLPPPSFAHMRASQHAASIYYADLFRINGKVWALTGTGKSDAGMAATARKRADDLARDSVAFVRDGTVLLGCYDQGAVNPEIPDDVCALHPLAVVVYCLSQPQTGQLKSGRPLGLVDVDAETVGRLLTQKAYPAKLAPYFFDAAELAYLCDGERRLRHWLSITNGVQGTRWLLAPWMPSAADKGALYTALEV